MFVCISAVRTCVQNAYAVIVVKQQARSADSLRFKKSRMTRAQHAVPYVYGC